MQQEKQNQDRARFGEAVETPVMGAADVVPGVKKKLPYAAPRIEVIEVSIEASRRHRQTWIRWIGND